MKSIKLSLVFILLILNACKGPKGDTGPTGPSGSAASDSTPNTYALKFLGTNGSVVIPYSPVLRPTAFTLEIWVYVDTIYSQFIPLISSSNTDQYSQADGYYIKFESGNYYLRLAKGPNLAAAYSVTYTPPTKQWIHLAASYDKKMATLYINGQQVAQYPDTFSVYYGAQTPVLGTGYHSNFGGYSHFRGMMDEVRIWNYARSATQIQQAMKTKLTGSEAGLLGYWDFDNNGFNPLAIDETANHNNGLLSGEAYFISNTPFK